MPVSRGAGGAARATREAAQGHVDDLVDAGFDVLLTDGIASLRTSLAVSAVQKRAEERGRPVPRASAYRVLAADAPGHDADATGTLVRRVAVDAMSRERSGFAEAHESMVEAFATRLGAAEGDGQDAVEEQLISALQANVDTIMASDGLPVSWRLLAASITASPAWGGTRRPTGPEAALAQDVLAALRTHYDEVTADLAPLMQAAMSAARRRPRPGMTPATLVKLLHAMLDGVIVRLIVEPDAFDTRLAAEAMYRIGLSFTEEGAHWDPRRRHGDQAAIFDAVVEAARARWRDEEEVTVESVAREVGVDPGAAAIVFPTDADLADSVVRSMVMSGGPAPETTSTVNAAQLAAMLWHLAEAADTHPRAVEIAQRESRHLAASIVADLRSFATQLVRASFPDDAPAARTADQTADDLVGFALEGRRSWRMIVPVLRMLGVPTDDVAPEG
ncbi:MAG TPA: hypothetical protein VIL48_07110 [Acidimicrobiales bacterium]